jgi:hypothetical protein
MSDDNEKKDADPSGEPVKNEVDLSKTRTGIMMKLAPVVDKALLDMPLDLENPDNRRRCFRALIHLGLKKMLDIGVDPNFLAQQMLEALGHELEYRSELNKISGGNVPSSSAMN